MDAIQGVGGTGPGIGLWGSTVRAANKADTHLARDQREDTPCMGAALSVSRDYLTFALQDSGFVDICVGPLVASDSDKPELQAEAIELDVQMATEVAAGFGQQVASSSIERILEIVSHPDPKYALKLLT